jgi:hypothetical protein
LFSVGTLEHDKFGCLYFWISFLWFLLYFFGCRPTSTYKHTHDPTSLTLRYVSGFWDGSLDSFVSKTAERTRERGDGDVHSSSKASQQRTERFRRIGIAIANSYFLFT